MMKSFLILVGTMLLLACSAERQNSAAYYLQQISYQPDDSAIQPPHVLQFIALYDNLEHVTVATAVQELYAETFYFNDTLVTIRDRDALVKYLLKTQSQLQAIEVSGIKTLASGNDIFISWVMTTEFQILGSQQSVQSIGISHLRFDEQGKIILHQDFWDSAAGFFEQIPVFGGVMLWLKNDMHTY